MSTSLFNVKLYNGAGGESKSTNCITVDAAIEDSDTLAKIRDYLVEGKKLDSDKARLAFCTPGGARMVDSTKFSVYQRILKGGEKKEVKKKGEDEEGEEGTKEENPESTESSDLKVYDIYLEAGKAKKKAMTELSESAKELLNSKLDMDLVKNRPELITATLKELASTYNHDKYRALTTGDVVTGASMSEKDWSVVLRNTNFLNGQRVVFSKNSNGTRSFQRIDRAPVPAFKLKPRHIDTLDMADASISVKELYRIPIFVTHDDSYVNVFETASTLSSSMASSSFSQRDIELSAGGGLFGASLSVKGGFSDSESNALATSSSEKTTSMNITYNFPRAVLHLDPRGLELTEDCQKDLKEVKDDVSLIRFHNIYGHFFAANVQLGGRLFASEQFSSKESGAARKTANAMKYSAAASFSYGSFSASASYSKEENSQSEAKSQASQMSSQLSWEAQGGDTVLCNNPPAWCPTVKPFRNWRVINQQDVMPIGDFIAQFKGYEHIPETFAKITEGTKKKVTCKFKLKAKDYDTVEDEYYGFRVQPEKKRLEKVLNAYADELRGTASDWIQRAVIDAHIAMLRDRMIGESFTVNFDEHVGINSPDDGCLFEVEVETVLERQPRLELNKPYFIYNKHFNCYLAADSQGSRGDRYFCYLFYCKKPRASRWSFREKGNRDKKGVIEDGKEVELTLLDEQGQAVGMVQRFTGDKSTLMVSKYNSGPDLTKRHDSRVLYVEDK